VLCAEPAPGRKRSAVAFTIPNVLLILAILCFVAAALQPAFLPSTVNLFNLGIGFTVASFLFQGKPSGA
jgi:hypothetical protein